MANAVLFLKVMAGCVVVLVLVVVFLVIPYTNKVWYFAPPVMYYYVPEIDVAFIETIPIRLLSNESPSASAGSSTQHPPWFPYTVATFPDPPTVEVVKLSETTKCQGYNIQFAPSDCWEKTRIPNPIVADIEKVRPGTLIPESRIPKGVQKINDSNKLKAFALVNSASLMWPNSVPTYADLEAAGSGDSFPFYYIPLQDPRYFDWAGQFECSSTTSCSPTEYKGGRLPACKDGGITVHDNTSTYQLPTNGDFMCYVERDKSKGETCPRYNRFKYPETPGVKACTQQMGLGKPGAQIDICSPAITS